MSAARHFAAGALAAACIMGAALQPARAQQALPTLAPPTLAPPTLPPPMVPPPMLPPPTLAPPTLPAPLPPPSPAERWYGWQILLVDAVGLGAMTAGGIPLARTNSKLGAGFFYAGWVYTNFSGMVVHAFHGGGAEDTTWKFALSYGMRVLLPAFGLLAGYGIGSKAAHCEPRQGCTGGMIAGLAVGTYAASIIDAAALGWEKVPAKPATRAPALRAVPSFAPVNGGFVAGVSGRF